MQEVIRFALLGLGLGSLYSLASQGLMVIYRGSGVLNFAHGAIGMVGAYVEWEVKSSTASRVVVAWAAGLLACAADRRADPPAHHAPAAAGLAAGPHRGHARRAHRAAGRRRAPLRLEDHVRDVGAAGHGPAPVRHHDLGRPLHPGRHRRRAQRRAVGAATATRKFGIATTAVAENQRAASAVGLSPDWIATVNWALGSALAGVAAILIAPIVQLQVGDDDQPRAGGAGDRAGRRLPVVPDRLRRRHAHRHRPDRADPLRRHARAWPTRCRSP